jgi:hypothetical protein
MLHIRARCKRMFQVFQVFYTYVLLDVSKETCFIRMLQVFYLDVAYVCNDSNVFPSVL